MAGHVSSGALTYAQAPHQPHCIFSPSTRSQSCGWSSAWQFGQVIVESCELVPSSCSHAVYRKGMRDTRAASGRGCEPPSLIRNKREAEDYEGDIKRDLNRDRKRESKPLNHFFRN